jgi:hypothetical protein
VQRESVEIKLLPERLDGLASPDNTLSKNTRGEPDKVIVLMVPARLKRAGTETSFLIETGEKPQRKQADHSVRRLLALAYRYHNMVMDCGGRPMGQLAVEAEVSGVYFARILKLSFLAPDVVQTMLRDNHPHDVTAKRLANDTQLPPSWSDQRALLGFK